MAGVSFSNLRPGFEIHPPAIARHVVFRLDTADNPRWIPDDEVREEKWDALCKWLARHVNALRAAHGRPQDVGFVPPDIDPGNVPRRYSLRGSCMIPLNDSASHDGYRLRVRVDVHTELFSFTYILDEIDRHAQRTPGLQMARIRDATDIGRQAKAIDWLFDKIWTSEEIPCAREISARTSAVPEATTEKGCLGRLLMDFRGIIMCPIDDWEMGDPSLVEPAIHDHGQRPGELDHDLVTFAKNHQSLVRKIADPPPPGPESSGGGEAVVCGMLDGKALYAASLGQWGEGVEPIQPIRHLLVYAGHSYAQLGRLLRRMHVLGEYRHAALVDYQPDSEREPGSAPADGDDRQGLRDASRAIRALGRELTAETRDITESDTPIEQLQGFVSELARISQMVDGGLTYRVEQSRYYAQEFKNTIKHLRLIRIGDWQPYDDFVQRYVLHLFARIDRIGNRFEALGRRLDRLLFFAQAKLLDSYTKSVESTVNQIREATSLLDRSSKGQLETLGAINHFAKQQSATLENIDRATALMNRSAEQQISASRKQIRLLAVAELFASVFLIYYIGSVVDHLFDGSHEGGSPEQTIYRIIWAAIIAPLGAWLLFRIAMPRSYRRLQGRLRLLWLPAKFKRIAKDASRLRKNRNMPRRTIR